MKLRHLAIVFTVFPLFSLRAAEEPKPWPTFHAVRAEKAPAVDADLSDPVWQNAPEMTGLTQRDPHEEKPAVSQTRIKAAYRDKTIYFAAESTRPYLAYLQSPSQRIHLPCARASAHRRPVPAAHA